MDKIQEILDKLPEEVNGFELSITKDGNECVVTYDNDFNVLHKYNDRYDVCEFSNESILIALQDTYGWLKKNDYV